MELASCLAGIHAAKSCHIHDQMELLRERYMLERIVLMQVTVGATRTVNRQQGWREDGGQRMGGGRQRAAWGVVWKRGGVLLKSAEPETYVAVTGRKPQNVVDKEDEAHMRRRSR